MDANTAIKAMNELCFAVHRFASISNMETVIGESPGPVPDEQSSLRLGEIKQDARREATAHAETILTQLLSRPPTQEEMHEALNALGDPSDA